MKNLKLFKLEISSFAMSFDAEHYYGKLHLLGAGMLSDHDFERIELKKKLSGKEAKYLNIKDRVKIYHKGMDTDRFDTKEEVIKAAISWIKNNYKKEDFILINGRFISRSAEPIVYYPISLKKEVAELNFFADVFNSSRIYDMKSDNRWREFLNKLIT